MQNIAIVGAGPRGISLLERIGAYGSPATATTIHIIDDAPIGAGRIWRTDQTPTLCMNTLAGAVTLFTEPGASVTAPVRPGPTMYEWAHNPLPLGGRDAQPTRQEQDTYARTLQDYTVELTHMRPESNPSRALYGLYLTWCYHWAKAHLPEGYQVKEHNTRAISIHSQGDTDLIQLANGDTLETAATILALGWQTPGDLPQETTLREQVDSAGLIWVRPDNPVEQDLSAIPAGSDVLVRGLGMGFFDVMALLTINRGGRFVADNTAASGLRYHPGGQEPRLLVTSGRGYPFLPKSHYGQLPPPAKLTRLKTVIKEKSATDTPIDFGEEVWSAIVRDAYQAYYDTLGVIGLEEIIDTTGLQDLPEVLGRHANQTTPFDLDDWLDPLGRLLHDGHNYTVEDITALIATAMATDIQEARAASQSPVKNALWEISAARKPASILGEQGRYTWESRSTTFEKFMALGQMVGSGPPLFRTQQLHALVEAGLVAFLGRGVTIEVRGDRFSAHADTLADTIETTILIDAWMHSPDVRRSQAPNADPLARSLEGRWRPWTETTVDGDPVATGSPEVDPDTRLLVGPGGEPDPRILLVGIPTYAQYADTTISPMPKTNPLMLQETDRAAGTVVGMLRRR